jgi:hypothetical protein
VNENGPRKRVPCGAASPALEGAALTLPADLGTTTVDVPLILVNGSRPGPRVVITGGVHGGEFIPVDATEHKITAVSTGTIIYHMNGLSVRPGTHLAAIATPHH